MIQLPEKLNETSVLPFISLLYQENKDYIKTYSEIVNHLKNINNYHKVGNLLMTFPTLMTFELINQKASLEEFNLLINHFHNNLLFNRQIKYFFNQDSSISIKDYKISKQNNINSIKYDIFDEISFVFLDYSDTKKVHLNTENLPYLHSLINKITIENCNEKDFFCLYYLPVLLTENVEDIAYLLEVNPDISHKFIISIADMESNNLDINDRGKIINKFKKHIPDFDKYFYNLILHNYNQYVQTFQADKYVNIIRIIGQDEFITNLTNHIENFLTLSSDVQKNYDRIITLCLNFKKAFQDTSFDLNENLINVNKKFIINCIPVTILQSQIEQGYNPNISKKIADYLIKENNHINNEEDINFSKKLNLELLINYAQYLLMENIVQQKKNQKNVKKI